MLRPGSAAAVGGLLEAVAVAVHGEDADVVSEPVEQCSGEPLGPQNLRPVLEGQVGGDDRRSPLVALREGLEQELCPCGRERNVAQFVNDQQLHGGKVALHPEQPLFVAGFHQLVHQRRGRGERDGEPRNIYNVTYFSSR